MLTRNILRVVFGLLIGTGLATAGAVTFTCDSGLTSDGTCAVLNSTIAALYGSTFTNANANVYIQYGVTGLASTLQFSTNVSYSIFASALAAHEGDANDVTAVNSLGDLTSNSLGARNGVTLTSALAQTLGLAATAGSVGTDTSGNSCTLGAPGCYNAVETLSNAANTWYYRNGSQLGGTYDIYTAVEHETDEVLGTPSCITAGGRSGVTTSVNCKNTVNGNPATGVSAADLFRWSAAGTRSYLTTANGTLAYFSINGGTTNLAGYNNAPNGADYGDWDSAALRVQNAFGTPNTTGVDITNDGAMEIAVLNAVGYNLATATPEPGTLGLFALSFAGLAAFKVRRRA